MAAIECGRGHLYDPNLYATCPYCKGGGQPAVMQQAGAPGFGQAPYGQPMGAGIPVSAPARTAPLNNYANVGPFEQIIGSGGVKVGEAGTTVPLEGYGNEKKVEDESVTRGYMNDKLGLEINPTVGWLVCVEGKQKGADFRLYGYNNTIGRSAEMDVCLKDDKTISWENHARINYSEKNNRFILTPADGKNMFYINGEEILTPTQLKAYDIIDFGETKMVFVPLCCEHFRWTE